MSFTTPSQAGKTFVVTGGSRGIGYWIVEHLARAGAEVIIAARSKDQADVATASVREHVPGASVRFIPLDLASLDSVATTADTIVSMGGIDGIALNGAVVAGSKERQTTVDGLELIVGTNYVGHFALLAGCFSALTPNARIVGMGSMATRMQKVDLNDLMQVNGQYSFDSAYAYSKHAVQIFGFELDRRLRASGSGIQSLVAHPGFALDVQAPKRIVDPRSPVGPVVQNLLRPMTQGKDRGAMPLVRALTDRTLAGGSYLGPRGGLKGAPVLKEPVSDDKDLTSGATLWLLSEQWADKAFAL